MQKYKKVLRHREEKMKARRLKKLFMGAVLAASLTFVAGKTPLLPVVQVQSAGMKDVEWDTSVDFEKAFQ